MKSEQQIEDGVIHMGWEGIDFDGEDPTVGIMSNQATMSTDALLDRAIGVEITVSGCVAKIELYTMLDLLALALARALSPETAHGRLAIRRQRMVACEVTAERNGHKLGNWVRNVPNDGRGVWRATCQKCGAEADVMDDRDVPPNGIAVSGTIFGRLCGEPESEK